MKEAKEETGIKHVKPILNDIYSLEIINVDGHEKRGKYVGSHVHLNVTYLLEADEKEEIHIKEDENLHLPSLILMLRFLLNLPP